MNCSSIFKDSAYNSNVLLRELNDFMMASSKSSNSFFISATSLWNFWNEETRTEKPLD